jgi:hypothetical protein
MLWSIYACIFLGGGYCLSLLIMEIFFCSLEICVLFMFIINALGIYVFPMSAMYCTSIFMTIMHGSIISISSSPIHGLISPKNQISPFLLDVIIALYDTFQFCMFVFECIIIDCLVPYFVYTVLSRCVWLAEQILYATVLSNAELAK